MTSTPSAPTEGPVAHLADSRARHQRQAQEHRALAARAVARMAQDPQDEARLLSILDLSSAVEAQPCGLESALAAYIELVAEQVDVPAVSVTHEVTDTATAYLGLAVRAADLPQRDLMLIWDERLGWSIAIEPRGNDRPPVICHLGGHVAPSPAAVAQFVSDVVHKQCRGQLSPVPRSLDREMLTAHLAAVPA
ncbi:DUF6292 family protein [Saccharomonospora piscinae]|nr:DUF6292 family protein [Saccharomonospora piscinae]